MTPSWSDPPARIDAGRRKRKALRRGEACRPRQPKASAPHLGRWFETHGPGLPLALGFGFPLFAPSLVTPSSEEVKLAAPDSARPQIRGAVPSYLLTYSAAQLSVQREQAWDRASSSTHSGALQAQQAAPYPTCSSKTGNIPAADAGGRFMPKFESSQRRGVQQVYCAARPSSCRARSRPSPQVLIQAHYRTIDGRILPHFSLLRAQ